MAEVNITVSMPSQLFTKSTYFAANAGGSIWIGKPDTDPKNPVNQIQVYVEQEDGTKLPVPQPILINDGGYPIYQGQIAKFMVDQNYSMYIEDMFGVQQFNFHDVLKYDPNSIREELASDNGTDLVHFKQPDFTNAVNNPITKRFVRHLDAVADYNADPTGNTDSTDALKKFFADLASGKFCIGELRGLFKVSSPILMEDVRGFTLIADAFIAATFDVGDYVFGIRGGGNGTLIGRLEFSASDKASIKTAIKVWSNGTDGGTSNIDFYSVSPAYAQLGWQFGDSAYPHALVSEITVYGGHTSGCPRVLRAIGSQTYLSFIGPNAVSSQGNFPDVTQYTISLVGAQVKWIGGEIQHNDNISGCVVLVEPINDTTTDSMGNSYGNFSATDVHIETAAALCQIVNLGGVANTISERCGVSFTGIHGYHSQNNGPLIAVDPSAADFKGFIMTRDMSMYAGVVRTQPNISALNAHVYYDEKGFGFNFVKGLQAVVGGILHFSKRTIIRVANSNGQVLNTNPNAILYSEPQANEDINRFISGWSVGTYTVPAGGLKDVEVNANVRHNGSGGVQLDVYVNNTVKTLGRMESNVSGGTPGRIYASLGDLNAGDTIQVRANVSTGTGQTNGGALELIAISAAR